MTIALDPEPLPRSPGAPPAPSARPDPREAANLRAESGTGRPGELRQRRDPERRGSPSRAPGPPGRARNGPGQAQTFTGLTPLKSLTGRARSPDPAWHPAPFAVRRRRGLVEAAFMQAGGSEEGPRKRELERGPCPACRGGELELEGPRRGRWGLGRGGARGQRGAPLSRPAL